MNASIKLLPIKEKDFNITYSVKNKNSERDLTIALKFITMDLLK